MTVESIIEWLEPDVNWGVAQVIEGTEDDPLPSGVIARIVFEGAQQADKKNGNGNIYPLGVLESSVRELNARAASGEVLMNATHPRRVRNAQGQVIGLEEADVAGPNGVAAKLTHASLDKKTGRVSITTEAFDTTAGKDIKAIAKGGGSIGTSSRSRGLRKRGVHEGLFGKVEGNILQSGMFMETFDFVTKPSVHQARQTSAQLESHQDGEYPTMTLEQLLKSHPELYKELKSHIESEAAGTSITEAEGRMRAEITEQTQTELKTLRDKVNQLEEDARIQKELVESYDDEEQVIETEYVVEDDPRVAALEAENQEIKLDLSRGRADTFLRNACESQSALGDIIFETTSGRADTEVEAKALFDFASNFADKIVKRLTDTTARGLPGHFMEGQNGGSGPKPPTARSTLRRLSGVD